MVTPTLLHVETLTKEQKIYFQRRRRQALVYCVTLGTEKRFTASKLKLASMRSYYEKTDRGKIIHVSCLRPTAIVMLILGK